MSRAFGSIQVALLLGLAGCSQSEGEAAKATIERSPDGKAVSIAIESDTLIDGRRATMTMTCPGDAPTTTRFDLVRPPVSPPEPRTVFAQIQIKGGPEATIELDWKGGATWEARMPSPSEPASDSDDRENQRRLMPILHAYSRERQLTLRPPAGHTSGGSVVWSPRAPGPELLAAQACATLD